MTAPTARAALCAIAQKPGVRFSLEAADGKSVHLRYEDNAWGGTFWLKTAGPSRELDADEDTAADLLCWLTGPLTITQLTGAAYEGGL